LIKLASAVTSIIYMAPKGICPRAWRI